MEWLKYYLRSVALVFLTTIFFSGTVAYAASPVLMTFDDEKIENYSVKLATSRGVDFYNYLNLFGRGEKLQNMAVENVDFMHYYLAKTVDSFHHYLKEIRCTEEVNTVKGIIKDNQFWAISFFPPSPGILILSLVAILSMFVIIFRILKKKDIHGQNFSLHQANKVDEVDEVLPEIDFVKYEKKISSVKSITPEVFSEVNYILNTLGQHKISKFRCMRLLEIVKESPMNLNQLQHKIATFHNDLSAFKKIEEEVLLGYLDIDDKNGILTLTGDGLKELEKSIRTEGYTTDLINFVNQRFTEHIIITCSMCGDKTLGFWFWKDYECSGCSRKGDVIYAAHLSLKTRLNWPT